MLILTVGEQLELSESALAFSLRHINVFVLAHEEATEEQGVDDSILVALRFDEL